MSTKGAFHIFFTTYDNVLDFLQIEINVALNPICYHFVLKTIPVL